MTPDELLAWAEQADRTLVAGVKRGVYQACERGAQTARTEHRYKDRSGELTKSIKGQVLSESYRGAEGEIRADARHASIVDGGTAPHAIYPRAGRGFVGALPKGQTRGRRGRAGKILRFVIGGRVVFARKVNHPGTRPDGFMGRAFIVAEQTLELEVRRGVAQAAKILGG